METTLNRYCFRWAIVEAKSPAMFKDFSICAKECAMYSSELGTCILFAEKYANATKKQQHVTCS